jgi:hypothetical protein
MLERFQPFSCHKRLKTSEAGDITARVRQTGDETQVDGIRCVDKYNGNAATFRLHSLQSDRAVDDDNIRLQADKLSGLSANTLNLTGTPAIVDEQVAALRSSQCLKPLPKRSHARLRFQILLSDPHKCAHAPDALGLLCAQPRPPEKEHR